MEGGVTGIGGGGWGHRNWAVGSLELGEGVTGIAEVGHWNCGGGSLELGRLVTGIGGWVTGTWGVRGAGRLGKIKSKRKI